MLNGRAVFRRCSNVIEKWSSTNYGNFRKKMEEEKKKEEKFYIWCRIRMCKSTSWGLTSKKAALEKMSMSLTISISPK